MTSSLTDEYHRLEERVLGAMREDLSEAEFGQIALEVFRFQRCWNTPYQRFCATRREPQDWRQIPPAPQGAFKRYALTVFPDALVARTFRTSGTTGEGYGQHHYHTTRLYDESVLRGWQRLALPQLRQIILAPRPQEAPHSSLSHMFGVLAAFGPQRYCIRADGRLDAAALAAELSSPEPAALLGTALAFLHLFESTPRQALPTGSFAMETGGYKGSQRDVPKPELYSMFEHFGISAGEVLNEYGMTELSSQFYTRGLHRPHAGAPWVRALVIDPETDQEVKIGETGMLRVFDLANAGSVLALQTQDLAIRRVEGFELLGRSPAALARGCSRAADEALAVSR